MDTCKTLIKAFMLTVVAMYGNYGFSQTAWSERNMRLIDSVDQSLNEAWCKDVYHYPAKYAKSELKKTAAIISVLNKLLGKDLPVSKLDTVLNRLNKKIRLGREEKLNGLIRVNQIMIGDEYFRAELTFESIDDYFIRKKGDLFTSTKAYCGLYQERIPDFQLLKKYLVNNFNFPIGIMDNEHLTVRVFNEDHLRAVSEKHPDYNFGIPDANTEKRVAGILYSQYNNDSSRNYHYGYVNSNFLYLVQHDNVDALKTLLYSPNYSFAVQAMESLIYLAGINKVVIDDRLKERIAAVRASVLPITSQNSDVIYTHAGYKEINQTDAQIIRKYQNSFR